jgi:transposase-like protein
LIEPGGIISKIKNLALPIGQSLLAEYSLPHSYRKRLLTNNMLERLNRENKRRTTVALLFPNEASLLRLIAAILVELVKSGKLAIPISTTRRSTPPLFRNSFFTEHGLLYSWKATS